MKDIFWKGCVYKNEDTSKDPLSTEPRYSLGRIVRFLEKLGNPQDKLPPIFHIAGTNGKGSVTSYLKYILEAEGYVVHRFTSPHIVDWNERIEVSGKIISDKYLNELVQECKDFSEKNNLEISYFELMVVMCCLAFTRNKADAVIFEVGLGGRLDATNVIKNSLVSIITSISFDHMKVLGDTLEKIAMEKAGIIKENGTLIINNQPEAKEKITTLLYNEGLKKNNKVYASGKEWKTTKLKNSFVYEGFGKKIELPLPYLEGDYQIDNAGGAISALLAQNKLKISEKSIINGLKNVRWIGRLQNISDEIKIKRLVPKNAEIIIDGAHNENASTCLKNWLLSKKDDKYNILIISMLERKDSKTYIKNLEKCFDMVITTNMRNEDKSKNSFEFKKEFLEQDWKNIHSSKNFEDALRMVKNKFRKKENLRIIMSGSLYFMGEILEYVRE